MLCVVSMGGNGNRQNDNKTAAEELNAGFMYYKMEDYPTAIAFFILALLEGHEISTESNSH